MTDLQVIATYGICNWGGVEIGNIDDESITYRYNFGEPEDWHLTAHDGEQFETYKGDTIELCECLRVGF